LSATPIQTKRFFIFGEIFRQTRYASRHVLSIPRVSACYDLLCALAWLPPEQSHKSPEATMAELQRYHTKDYVEAVYQAEINQDLPEHLKNKYNIGRQGNPIYPGMFHRPATACGGGLLAVDLTWHGGIAHNPAGGTHHAQKDHASGFCFFNEPVLTILKWLDKGLKRIVYLDFDAHHGDGVQNAFHDDSRVLTISIHEAHRWPYSGLISDFAGGLARNIPVPKDFHDAELLFLMNACIMPLIRSFQPEALYLQCGVDALADDPQSNLMLSNNGLWTAIEAATHLAPRIIIGGGGGYNPWSVARGWAGIWGKINHLPIADPLPQQACDFLAQLEWRHSRGRNPPNHWFKTLADRPQHSKMRDVIRELPPLIPPLAL